MKKSISTLVAVSSLTLLCPIAGFAQWDNRQDRIGNQTQLRIENNRRRERLEARLAEKKRGAKSGKSRRSKRGASAKKVAAPVPAYGIWFQRDPWRGYDVEADWQVNLSFVSAKTGKTFPRVANFTYWGYEADFWDVPAGAYTVRAEVVRKGGKKSPALLGTYEGPKDEKPTSEKFAPSMKVTLKPIKKIGGKYVEDLDPMRFYVRLVE